MNLIIVKYLNSKLLISINFIVNQSSILQENEINETIWNMTQLNVQQTNCDKYGAEGAFSWFLPTFLILLLEILNMASQLRRKSRKDRSKGAISCFIFVTVRSKAKEPWTAHNSNPLRSSNPQQKRTWVMVNMKWGTY